MGAIKNISAEVHLPGIIPVFSDKDLKIPVELDIAPENPKYIGVETRLQVIAGNKVLASGTFKDISKAYFHFKVDSVDVYC
ncbi:MAG: hypothetical protein GXO43_03940 [Crenarchaeota archaeon]|nr:hypothetical protein [Thermoproteota archaeon]